MLHVPTYIVFAVFPKVIKIVHVFLPGFSAFVILTRKRKYIMKTETLTDAEEWMQVFQSAICDTDLTWL